MCDRPGNALSKLVFYCYMVLLLQVNEALINIHMLGIDILSSGEEERKIRVSPLSLLSHFSLSLSLACLLDALVSCPETPKQRRDFSWAVKKFMFISKRARMIANVFTFGSLIVVVAALERDKEWYEKKRSLIQEFFCGTMRWTKNNFNWSRSSSFALVHTFQMWIWQQALHADIFFSIHFTKLSILPSYFLKTLNLTHKTKRKTS